MPIIPRKGHQERRDEIAAKKKNQIEDMTGQQQMMMRQREMMMRQQQMQQQQMRQNQKPMSYEERKAQRRKDLLTQEEVNEGVEDGSNHGKYFRVFFVGLVACILLFLMLLKVDAETIDMPEEVKRLSYSAQGAVNVDGKENPLNAKDKPETALNEKDQKVLDGYLELLNVKKEDPADNVNEESTETPQERIKRKRREKAELKRKVKAAFDEKMDEQNALVTCGRSCQEKYGQVAKAYEALNQEVDNELFSVVLDEEDAESMRENHHFVNPSKLKKSVEKKISELKSEEVEEGSQAAEDQQLAIQEIQDAYNILANTESRTYYLMYGKKPPAAMSKVSAREGGWGQQLLLRTHYHKLILTWLQFFENSRIDLTVILFVFFCLFLGPALARLPQTVAMAQRMADEWEQMAEMEKRGRKAD